MNRLRLATVEGEPVGEATPSDIIARVPATTARFLIEMRALDRHLDAAREAADLLDAGSVTGIAAEALAAKIVRDIARAISASGRAQMIVPQVIGLVFPEGEPEPP